MLQKYKHVIWDWNGTLLDDVNLCVDIINCILTRRQLKILTSEQYREIFTFPVKNYYLKAGLDFNKYPFEILGSEWMEQYEQRRGEMALIDGAREVLSSVQKAGISQSILSAYRHDTLVDIVSYFKLDQYFTYLSGLDHIYAHGKSETGKELIAKIGLSGHDVVLIGDTVHDFEVAAEIGIDSILIAGGHQSREKLLQTGAPVFDSILELKL